MTVTCHHEATVTANRSIGDIPFSETGLPHGGVPHFAMAR